MSMIITRAKAGHLAEITQIERETFPDPWSARILAHKISDPATIFLIAEQESEIQGYALLQCIPPEAELTNFAVTEKARRSGTGRYLLKALLQEAKNQAIEAIHLEVRAGNTPAIALYTSRGFQPAGLRKNYYKNPNEHAVLMTLTVNCDQREQK